MELVIYIPFCVFAIEKKIEVVIIMLNQCQREGWAETFYLPDEFFIHGIVAVPNH